MPSPKYHKTKTLKDFLLQDAPASASIGLIPCPFCGQEIEFGKLLFCPNCRYIIDEPFRVFYSNAVRAECRWPKESLKNIRHYNLLLPEIVIAALNQHYVSGMGYYINKTPAQIMGDVKKSSKLNKIVRSALRRYMVEVSRVEVKK